MSSDSNNEDVLTVTTDDNNKSITEINVYKVERYYIVQLIGKMQSCITAGHNVYK